MYKRTIIIILMLSLIAACSKAEPALVKKDTTPVDPNSGPELVEQKVKEETEEFIEFSLQDELVMVNLKMVPILNEYLHAVTDRQKVIREMDILRIDNGENISTYLLEFSCLNERCSYILLDQSQENGAYLVADLAKIAHTELSPDQTKILFQFNRYASTSIPLTNLVVIDLEKWELLSVGKEPDDRALLNYNWPILESKWVDNESIIATLPNIMEPSSEQILEWAETSEITRNITFQIMAND